MQGKGSVSSTTEPYFLLTSGVCIDAFISNVSIETLLSFTRTVSAILSDFQKMLVLALKFYLLCLRIY